LRAVDLALTVSPQADLALSADSEALQVLTDRAEHGKAGTLADALARSALVLTAGGGFALARDALDAMLRRLDSARGGELIVKATEAGRYRVGRRGRGRQHYDVWIGDPKKLEGSCGCLDFGKASLGVCKHVLAAIEGRARRSRRGARAARRPSLRWNPVRPLTGAGDSLARLWFDRQAGDARPPRGLFRQALAGCPIDPARLADPAARRSTLERLLAACTREPLLSEPAVLPLLVRELATLSRGHALAARGLDRLLRGLKRPLFPYQREGVARFVASGRLLLADDMGLGKTAQAIAACHALFAAGEIQRVIIVLPAPLKPQWEREWRSFTEIPIRSVDGHPDERAQIYERRERGALLVNYEQLLRDLPLVQAYAPDLAILDEAQRIKNWETKTATVVKQLDTRWRLVLTGTPMENRIDELVSIMDWVDEHALEPRWRLPSWHTIRADGSREVIGARNLDTLRARLAPAMLRRVRAEVLAQLPPRRDLRVAVPLLPAQQEAHDELDPPIAQIVARAQHRALTQSEFLRLMKLLLQQRMICSALALREFDELWPSLERARRRTPTLLAALGSPKLLEFRERIANLVVTQGRKVVVFSQWRRMLRLASWVAGDLFAAAGVRCAFFTGEESQRRRTDNLVAFHDDPDLRVLFATDAGGVGLNLQRAASCCINLELPWNPAVLEQRIGRIYRLGQEQPVESYNLVAASGIEARIANLVGDKRALFTGLFDGTSDEVPFDSSGSFLTRVHEVLQQPEQPVAPNVEADAGADADADAKAEADAESDADAKAEAEAIEAKATDVDAAQGRQLDAGELSRGSEGLPDLGKLTLDVSDLAATLSQISVRPLEGGRISVELPRAAATALGGLLRALASAVEGGPSGDASAQGEGASAP
jgi:SNF2-related domain/Helicase conserved C-terminal domain